MLEAEKTHRAHAIVEQVIADLVISSNDPHEPDKFGLFLYKYYSFLPCRGSTYTRELDGNTSRIRAPWQLLLIIAIREW